MAVTVLVPLAEGFEEIEAVTIIDVLRRAGAEVVAAATGSALAVMGARGVRVLADALLADVAGREFELIALPGGVPGATNLAASAALNDLLQSQASADRLIGAICAAPAVALQPLGLLQGKHATCYPSFGDRLGPAGPAAGAVVRDGQLLTSRGPGTAMAFALALAEALFGPAKRAELAQALLAE